MTNNTPLRIVGLSIENVKRINAVTIMPEGSAVIIGGNNAQGKTSILDAIEMALSGKKIDKPVREGSTKGRVVADLGEIVVTRTFTEHGGGTLTVATAAGAKFSSPQTMLDELFGRIAFDPLAFTRMKPKEQLETLREICGINTLMLDNSRAATFDLRTEVNRRCKDLEAQIAGMPEHKDAPAAPLDPVALRDELQKATKANEERAEYIRQGREKVAELERVQSDIAKAGVQIVEMERALEMAKTGLANKKQTEQIMVREITEMREKSGAMKEIDTAELVNKMGDIANANRKHDENARRAQLVETLQIDAKKAKYLTDTIDGIDEKKRARLAGAKYPVTGLLLTDDGIAYNGIPFEQASAAEQLRVSVGIGLAANPRLRVMLVRDGALLDDNSLAALEKMAEDADAQVWIERVGEGAECSVIIRDGEVVSD